MYFLPLLKRTSRVILTGSGLAAVLFMTGCASTKSSKSSAASDEALYLFDDGTGDLPSAGSYASNDSGADLDFTASEQVASNYTAPAPEKPSRKSRRERRQEQQQQQQLAQQTQPTQETMYLHDPVENTSGASAYGANGPGPANYNASSDVVSTPPTPVSGGSNYGASYAASDSGSADPVETPKKTTSSSSSTKKKSASSSGSGSSSRTYVVKRGDTLSEIATRNGTTVSSLKLINGLSSNTIQVGQKLKVSGKGGAKATATSGKKSSKARSHTVKSGDNLWEISKKYGVTVTALKKVNGMSSSTLRPGQKLKLP